MDYLDAVIELTYYGIQKETRLSERQVRQLRWEQIHGNVISTVYGREVQLSAPLAKALALLPSQGERFVFPVYTSPADATKRDKQEILKNLRRECRQERRRKWPRLRLEVVRG